MGGYVGDGALEHQCVGGTAHIVELARDAGTIDVEVIDAGCLVS